MSDFEQTAIGNSRMLTSKWPVPQGGNQRGKDMGNAILLDHLATSNEICEAFAFSSLDVFERISAGEVCCEVASDSRGGIRVLAEEFAWLALAKQAMEAIETRSN
jgi:hypothetical protein